MSSPLYIKPVKLALYGPAGSGKDYVTDKLIRHVILNRDDVNIEFKRFAFADKLKKIANMIVGLNLDSDFILAKESESFKNNFFIDLETFKTRWILELPSEHNFLEVKSTHKRKYFVFFDKNAKEEDDKHYIIYKASDLEMLLSNSSKFRGIIPNMVQFDGIEEVLYPSGIDKMKYRRLISYREFIVWLGTYCFQRLLGLNCMVNMMINDPEYVVFTSSPYHGSIVTDVRFPHEYEALKKDGYKFVRIVPEQKDIDIENIAETHYSEFEPDFDFFNSRDKGHFAGELDRLVEFIKDNFAEPFDSEST